MVYHFDQSLIWHVIFHPGRLWGGKYRHVSLAGYADTTWINLDLHRGGVAMSLIYRHDEVHDYLTFLNAHYTIIKFGPARSSRMGQFGRPLTCVGFAKHLLGFKSGALRPDGLLRDLTRDRDAELINEAQDPIRNSGAESSPATR